MATDGRLNWGYVVSYLITEFVKHAGRTDGIKMWHEPISGAKKNNVIYEMTLTPDEKRYCHNPHKQFTFSECIRISIKYAGDKTCIYNGYISDFKSIEEYS